jgi:hypothetical protein
MAEKKNQLLSTLKQQVLLLKSQLEGLEKYKPNRSSLTPTKLRSISNSSRLNAHNFDTINPDKGVKKFPEKGSRFHNIAQLIQEKSALDPVPNISAYRKAEYNKTKENFNTENSSSLTPRQRGPNPLTGEGYKTEQKGLKIIGAVAKQAEQRNSSRKHFKLYM